jgi:hypothetical protein
MQGRPPPALPQLSCAALRPPACWPPSLVAGGAHSRAPPPPHPPTPHTTPNLVGSRQVLRDQKALLTAGAPSLRWLGYLSSTGVYGNWDGAWVDET